MKDFKYGNYAGLDKFPLDCESLEYLQGNTRNMAAMAMLAGTDCLVLSGCELSTDTDGGETRGEGYVFVREPGSLTGEVVYHPSQPAMTGCTLASATEPVTANGETFPDAYETRWLQESNPGTWSWKGDVKRASDMSNYALRRELKKLQEAIEDEETTRTDEAARLVDLINAKNFVPMGTIVMWSSIGEVPSGWAICDGSSVKFSDGVIRRLPDYRGRFPVGVDMAESSFVPGYTAGSKTQSITLDVQNLPKHSHAGSTQSAGAHTHTIKHRGYFDCKGDNKRCMSFDSISGDPQTSAFVCESAGSHNHAVTIGYTGSGTPFTVPTLPPYLAVYFIIKL